MKRSDSLLLFDINRYSFILVILCFSVLKIQVYAQKKSNGIKLNTISDQEVFDSVVFFAFDKYAFPYTENIQTHLIPGSNPKVILKHGPIGSHDEFIRYYGTVIRIDGTFHMWYIGNYGPEKSGIGFGHGAHTGVKLCYARSHDGVNWEKPNLGFVKYNGSTVNNIVDFPEPAMRPAAAILYDPEEINPDKRFKMAYEAERDGRPKFCVAFSPNGMHWKLSEKNPVGGFFEMQGITKFQGKYYVNGQNSMRATGKNPTRKLITYVSNDFENWSPCGAVGLNRSIDLSGPSRDNEWNIFEEVHLGAGLWNRGNVIVGIYGQWHGHPTGDRRLVSIDLGLCISHDALHFYEPIPDYRIIPAREQPDSPDAGYPALMQGQGMENVGDKTYYWYSLWKGIEGTGVRMVTWEKDRLGMVQPYANNAMMMSCPFTIQGHSKIKVFINASGLGKYATIKISLLDQDFTPILGYSEENAAVINESGLDTELSWGAGSIIPQSENQYHLLIQFEGVRSEDCKLHALYLKKVE